MPETHAAMAEEIARLREIKKALVLGIGAVRARVLGNTDDSSLRMFGMMRESVQEDVAYIVGETLKIVKAKEVSDA